MPKACTQEDSSLSPERLQRREARASRCLVSGARSGPACPQACSSASSLLCMAGSGLFRLCFPGCLVSRLLARCCLGKSLARDWRMGWGGRKYRIFSSPAWMPSLTAAAFLSWPQLTHYGSVFFRWPCCLALESLSPPCVPPASGSGNYRLVPSLGCLTVPWLTS